MKRTLLIISAILFLAMASEKSTASVIYTPMNITASQTSAWNWFAFPPDANGFGLWVNVGLALRLETYQGPVIGTVEDDKVYLTAIEYGSEIGAGSAWVVPAVPSYINDATHQTLNGQTVYIGVQLLDADAAVYYGWMKLVVAADGLSVTLEGMAYQDEAGEPLLAGVIDRQVYYDPVEFVESLVTNDGTIDNQVNVSLEGVDFSVAEGNLTPGDHFVVENLPAGLEVSINVRDARNAVVSLSGQAGAHSEADTRYDFTIQFNDEAFEGVAAGDIIDATMSELVIKFFDPYKIVYGDLESQICGVNGWVPFSNDYYDNAFGLWHDGTDMRLETYAKSVVGTVNLGKSLITPLDEGTLISTESPWVTTGNWPNEPYINTSTYTSWNGKQKYAGIQLEVGSAVLYGWLNLEVSADGSSVTIHEWAFNTQPEGPIVAGQKSSGILNPGLGSQKIMVAPNPFHGQLMVTFSEPLKGAATIEILDLTGRRVGQKVTGEAGSRQVSMNTNDLVPGFYIISVESGSQRTNIKILKE